MKIAPAVIAQHRQDEVFEVWPENWPAVQLFLRSQTQWHTDFGQRTGLNLPGVRMVARAMRIAWDADLLDALQIMEAATLEELARQARLSDDVQSHR